MISAPKKQFIALLAVDPLRALADVVEMLVQIAILLLYALPGIAIGGLGLVVADRLDNRFNDDNRKFVLDVALAVAVLTFLFSCWLLIFIAKFFGVMVGGGHPSALLLIVILGIHLILVSAMLFSRAHLSLASPGDSLSRMAFHWACCSPALGTSGITMTCGVTL